jgi:hypothetical protein
MNACDQRVRLRRPRLTPAYLRERRRGMAAVEQTALLSDYLAANEMRVTAVASGKELLAVMARDTVDLVVLDVRLQGRGRHADRAPAARGLGDPDPDADRPCRGGRPRDGPRARRRRLPDRSIDVQILRQRRKIEPDPTPRFIVTQRGSGYVFDATVEVVR